LFVVSIDAAPLAANVKVFSSIDQRPLERRAKTLLFHKVRQQE
jgi:hypothetical protein